jgi:uncharacterized protein with PIN domain
MSTAQHAPEASKPEGDYAGVRCLCVLTGCRAGPGCPLHSQHCKDHVAFVQRRAELAKATEHKPNRCPHCGDWLGEHDRDCIKAKRGSA